MVSPSKEFPAIRRREIAQNLMAQGMGRRRARREARKAIRAEKRAMQREQAQLKPYD